MLNGNFEHSNMIVLQLQKTFVKEPSAFVFAGGLFVNNKRVKTNAHAVLQVRPSRHVEVSYSTLSITIIPSVHDPHIILMSTSVFFRFGFLRQGCPYTTRLFCTGVPVPCPGPLHAMLSHHHLRVFSPLSPETGRPSPRHLCWRTLCTVSCRQRRER